MSLIETSGLNLPGSGTGGGSSTPAPGVAGPVVTTGASLATTYTVDMATGWDIVVIGVITANVQINITNPVAGKLVTMRLEITGSGGYTVTFSANVAIMANSLPINTVTGAKNELSFFAESSSIVSLNIAN